MRFKVSKIIIPLIFLLALSLIAITPVRAPPFFHEPETFGNIEVFQPLNWTKFWALFNAHTLWDLEYNEGAGWISSKQDLQVQKNYYYEENTTFRVTYCKMTLIFTASHSADYRLTFAIDLDVKEYIYKESEAKYLLTYKEYNVYFDFSDLKTISGLTFNSGVKTIAAEKYWWFRVSRNNVPKGANLTLDPTFGTTQTNMGWAKIDNLLLGSTFNSNATGTALSISAHLDPSAGAKARAAIYDKASQAADEILLAQTEELTFSSTDGIGWYNFTFPTSYNFENKTYILIVHGQGDIYLDTAGAGAYRGRSLSRNYQEGLPSSLGAAATTASIQSLYCTYATQLNIGEFQAPSTVHPDEYFFLNTTILGSSGVSDFINATIEISKDIILKWDNATDTFSEYQDSNNYCTLDASNSIKASVNSTAYKLSWQIKLADTFPEGATHIIASNTKVYDSSGYASNSRTSLFNFIQTGEETGGEEYSPWVSSASQREQYEEPLAVEEDIEEPLVFEGLPKLGLYFLVGSLAVVGVGGILSSTSQKKVNRTPKGAQTKKAAKLKGYKGRRGRRG